MAESNLNAEVSNGRIKKRRGINGRINLKRRGINGRIKLKRRGINGRINLKRRGINGRINLKRRGMAAALLLGVSTPSRTSLIK
jgi:predicted sulfurtransferase